MDPKKPRKWVSEIKPTSSAAVLKTLRQILKRPVKMPRPPPPAQKT